MATIDDKINDLNFEVITTRTPEQVAQAAADAAEIASTGGPKITLTRVSANQFDGVVRNFVRVQHASFTATIEPREPGQSRVRLDIGDYLRTRDTVLFIPVTPWTAPAYNTLKTFSEYLRGKL